MKLFGMQKTRSFLLLFFSVISRYACIMTSCLTSKPRKPAKPQTTTCKRKGKANAKTLSPLKQQKKPKKRGRKKKQQSRCNRLRHTRYCRSSSNSSRHGTALVSTNINFDWKPYIWILHFFLHSADPIIAPVPTSGIISPMLAGLKDASPKPALMTSWGTDQRLGRMLRVPLSSLLRALRRRAGSQSVGWCG